MIGDKLTSWEQADITKIDAAIERMIARHQRAQGKRLRVHIGPVWSVPWYGVSGQRPRQVWGTRWHGEY